MFVTVVEPTVTHHNHPKSIIYLKSHSWCYMFCGFGQMNKDMYRYSIIQSIFTALKIPCVLPIHRPPFPRPLENTDLFTVSIVLTFPQCYVIGIRQYVASSDWFLSLNNMHLRFLHVFSWLDSPFLFSDE